MTQYGFTEYRTGNEAFYCSSPNSRVVVIEKQRICIDPVEMGYLLFPPNEGSRFNTRVVSKQTASSRATLKHMNIEVNFENQS